MTTFMSDGHSPKQGLKTPQDLKSEIDRLFELQRQALDRATYLGMTPQEATEMEARRKEITSLVNQLAQLKSGT
jgi:hypothetical protein